MERLSRALANGFPHVIRRRARQPATRMSDTSVLVVDGESLIRWSLSESLRNLGCQVATAADNASAIDVVGSRRAHPFDVVLLDCSVSHMAGSSLPLLLEMSATSAFVVMMAFPTIELEAEALRLGASAVLRKPFALEEVIHLVRVLVEPEPC